jgi:hypothetical protein
VSPSDSELANGGCRAERSTEAFIVKRAQFYETEAAAERERIWKQSEPRSQWQRHHAHLVAVRASLAAEHRTRAESLSWTGEGGG